MTTVEPGRARSRPDVREIIRDTFNAAAPFFDSAPLFFWDRFGRRTVELAPVRVGDRVLDVCCGTGASAIPAAERTGPAGHVLGVDRAEQLLARAAAKARRRSLAHAEFRVGDMARLAVADGSVDVTLCVLGLYFADDPGAGVAELWRTVGDGGRLAVTTWGPRALEPANTYYLEAVAEIVPHLDVRARPLSWERMNTPATLSAAFTAGGAPRPVVDQETVVQAVEVDDFWTVVLGSGYRTLLWNLSPVEVDRVRDGLRRRIERAGLSELTADVLYARARRV